MRDDIRLLCQKQVVGVYINKPRLYKIGEDSLLAGSIRPRCMHASKGHKLAFGYFLEIFRKHAFRVIANDADHFMNLFGCELLIHAAHEEGEVVEGQHAIVVYVDHLECLANLLLRVEVAVYVVACGLQVESALVRDVLVHFLGLLFLTLMGGHWSQ